MDQKIEDHISSAKAAKALGVTTRTLRTWWSDPKTGFPQPVKLGGRSLFFRVADIQRFLELRHADRGEE